MSLLAKTKAWRPALPLRGTVSTPVAVAPVPARSSVPREPYHQLIRNTKSGPEPHKYPHWLAYGTPIWGSPEAADALESAWAKWRQEHGEIVDWS